MAAIVLDNGSNVVNDNNDSSNPSTLDSKENVVKSDKIDADAVSALDELVDSSTDATEQKESIKNKSSAGRYDGWESMWSRGGGLKKGQAFDAELPLPALTNWLSSSKPSDVGVPENGSVLVAGCGRGYAPIAFSQSGYKALGLDVSSTAIKSAKEYLSAIDGGDVLPVSFTEASFFDYPEDDAFDMAYDYTFFCALQPEDRKPWAQTYARLIKHKGILVTGMFPVDKDRKGGPPFAVTPELYQSVLEPAGFALVEEPKVLSNEEAHDGRGNGKTMFGMWRNVGVKKDEL